HTRTEFFFMAAVPGFMHSVIATAGTGTCRTEIRRKWGASSRKFSSGTGRSSTGGENDERGVPQPGQNRQVYSVEGADAVICRPQVAVQTLSEWSKMRVERQLWGLEGENRNRREKGA